MENKPEASEESPSRITKNIFSAFTIVGISTILVKILSLFKEMLIAYRFGVGDELDAFIMAFLLPSFAINVFVGSFGSAFMPLYIEVKKNKKVSEFYQFFSSTITLFFLIIAVLSLILVIISPLLLPFLASGFEALKLKLTQSLFYILIFCLVVSGVSKTWSVILNAEEKFTLAALSPSAIPVTVIVFILFLANHLGIYALALGTLVGFLFEMIILTIGVKRYIPFSRISWNLDVRNKQMFQVIKQYIPMIAGAFLMGSTTLVDQSMASMLGSGSVSALNYGDKLISFVLSISAFSLSTAVFPYFSKMVAGDAQDSLNFLLKKIIRYVLVLSFFSVIPIIVFSQKIVSLLFQRGAFTYSDSILVAEIQILYSLQIPFYLAGIVFVKLISSFKKNHLLMWGAFINLFFNIILNYLFMHIIGVPGIALSTSIVYFISFVYLWSCVKKIMVR